MFTLLDNKKGYAALIGLLVVILLIAVLIYGGSFFSSKSQDISSDLNAENEAREKIDAINQLTEERAELIGDNISGPKSGRKPDIEMNIEEGENLKSPLTIEGSSNYSGDELNVELRNNKHEALVSESVRLKELDETNKGFEITLYFEFTSTKEGFVALTDMDGRLLLERAVRFNESDDEGEVLSE